MTKTNSHRKRLFIFAITTRHQQQQKKKHKSSFPEEKCNIKKSKYFLYFLQNHADLRIGMGGEKKREGERVVRKVTLLLFQGVGTENTYMFWLRANLGEN